jgi:hypothetical protein
VVAFLFLDAALDTGSFRLVCAMAIDVASMASGSAASALRQQEGRID